MNPEHSHDEGQSPEVSRNIWENVVLPYAIQLLRDNEQGLLEAFQKPKIETLEIKNLIWTNNTLINYIFDEFSKDKCDQMWGLKKTEDKRSFVKSLDVLFVACHCNECAGCPKPIDFACSDCHGCPKPFAAYDVNPDSGNLRFSGFREEILPENPIIQQSAEVIGTYSQEQINSIIERNMITGQRQVAIEGDDAKDLTYYSNLLEDVDASLEPDIFKLPSYKTLQQYSMSYIDRMLDRFSRILDVSSRKYFLSYETAAYYAALYNHLYVWRFSEEQYVQNNAGYIVNQDRLPYWIVTREYYNRYNRPNDDDFQVTV